MNIQEITYKSKLYPELLRTISAPPKQLFVLGVIPDLPMVSIVGSRKPSEYGKQITYKLAFDLARAGICVVSGMALGIDGVAHQAALEAGCKTIAVLGCGLDKPYPASNQHIFKRIAQGGGAVISEYPLGTPGLKQNFPARNRIIAGLSLATIVTEADASSGSLITANFATVENRMIMAVPGNLTSPRSAGPNNLIKLGAKLITNATDVLAELELKSTLLKTQRVLPASKEEALVIELIENGHIDSHAMIDNSSFDAPTLAHVLSLMEITGKIRNLGAGQWMAS